LIPAPKGPKSDEPGSNIEDLAEAILTLVDNRALATEMGRRGRQLALEQFNWARYLEGLSELYSRILDGHRIPTRRAA
jgi:glycosyltransferase involved in cell wall biosynthesis